MPPDIEEILEKLDVIKNQDKGYDDVAVPRQAITQIRNGGVRKDSDSDSDWEERGAAFNRHYKARMYQSGFFYQSVFYLCFIMSSN